MRGRSELDVLELKGRQLAHDPAVRVNRADERGQRAADVARDLDGRAGGAKHRPEELGRRRLPVRPGDAEHGVREQPRAELDLAPHRNARVRAPATSRVSPGTPGLFTSRSVPCSNVSSSSPRWSSTPRSRSLPIRRLRPRRGRTRRPSPPAEQRLGGRLPRAGEADDEDAPAAEPGIGAHCWKNWRKSR